MKSISSARLLLVAFLFLATVFLAVPLSIDAWESRASYETVESAPSANVAIVLGASVYQGMPSPVLAARAQTAVQLYLLGKVKKILVTGDNSALTHDEVTPVRKFLLDAGVLPQDIFLDHAGFDTYSSMYRARAIFQASRAIVVTQAFHLPRALFLARSLGLAADGVEAGSGAASFYEYLREIPATWKAVFDVLTHRQPKYLGAPIPLSGSGESTWY